jgi:hypothetical protein
VARVFAALDPRLFYMGLAGRICESFVAALLDSVFVFFDCRFAEFFFFYFFFVCLPLKGFIFSCFWRSQHKLLELPAHHCPLASSRFDECVFLFCLVFGACSVLAWNCVDCVRSNQLSRSRISCMENGLCFFAVCRVLVWSCVCAVHGGDVASHVELWNRTGCDSEFCQLFVLLAGQGMAKIVEIHGRFGGKR